MPRNAVARPKKATLEKMEQVMGEARENMALWVKQRIDEVTAEKDAHIEALRNGTEHPTPYCQKMAHFFAAMGLEDKYVAKMLHIPYSALMRHYEEDLKLGYAEALVTMGSTLYKIGSDPTHKDAAKVALEWMTRFGGKKWALPTSKVQLEQPKDKSRIINADELSYEDRQQLRAMILRTEPTAELTDDEETDEPAGE